MTQVLLSYRADAVSIGKPYWSEVSAQIGRDSKILVRSILRGGELAIVYHEDGILNTIPVTREAGGKALGKKEHMVSTISAVPIRIVSGDDTHRFAEMISNVWHSMRLMHV